jgi:uncharacterized protein (DUF2141 family)
MGICLRTLALSALLCSAGPAAATELKLRLDGLKPKGQVLVLLFDAEQAWKAKDGRRPGDQAPGERGRGRGSPGGSAPGKVWRHGVPGFEPGREDELQRGRAGRSSPYGFSNNSRGLFGPPAWSKAAFRFGSEPIVHAIRLK